MALIKCTDISFAYNGTTVLSDVNFTVNQGDYLCIVGANGSGKSTLIKGLLHLKKVTGGTIEYGDGLKENEIGYLPQQSDAQRNFPASVFEVVLSGKLNTSRFKPFYTADDKEDALDKMALLGISELKKHCYNELSGGQQQRVLLARALCATKKLLLLDEPVAGLDPIVTADMYNLIQKINHEKGITVVMVSHDMSAALKHASHILQLGHKQLFYGSTEHFIESGSFNKFTNI